MFLITSLIISALIMMFVGAALALAPGSLAQATSMQTQDAAERAALCGVEYVLSRISQNPDYCSQASGQKAARVVVDTPNLFVKEDHGNIVGLMWDQESGQMSQFRVRFNYHDGAGKADQLDDPAAGMKFDLPYVSINDANEKSNKDVPKVTGAGFSVVNKPPVLTTIPAHSVYLAVEGRAGKGLSSLSRANPNAAPGYGAVTTRVIETVYKGTVITVGTTDAVMMARGDISLRATGTSTLESANSIPGRVRALDSIDFRQPDKAKSPANVVTPNLSAELMNAGANAIANTLSSPVSKKKDSGGNFYKLAWADIPSAPPTSSKMAAGTYVVDSTGTLTYFDMPHGQYVDLMKKKTPPTGKALTTSDLPAGVTFQNTAKLGDPANYELKISQDVEIEPTAAGTNDFAYMPKRGAPAGEGFSSATAATDNFKDYFQFDGTSTWKRTNSLVQSDQLESGPVGSSLRSIALSGGINSSPPPSKDGYNNVNFTVPVGSGSASVKVEPNGTTTVTGLGASDSGAFLTSLYGMFPSNPSNSLSQNIAYFQSTVGGSVGAGADVNSVADETDPVTTENLTLNISPAAGKTATLTGPSGVTVGANLVGNGGSVTSQGEINLFGFGVNLAASTANGVSLYAKKDINISTFYQSAIDSSGKPAAVGYRDVSLTGVVYAWGNIKAIIGDPNKSATWKDFNLTGTMVAYGGDPSGTTFEPTDISITAKEAHLKFDSSYLLNLMKNPSVKLERTSYAVH